MIQCPYEVDPHGVRVDFASTVPDIGEVTAGTKESYRSLAAS